MAGVFTLTMDCGEDDGTMLPSASVTEVAW